MACCKLCKATLPQDTLEWSFTRIEQLLRLQNAEADRIPQTAAKAGPLCGKCLDDWYREFIFNQSMHRTYYFK